jgi:hypothetical protein
VSFGQASGPPASAKQLAQLGEALAAAGYASFREARHPLGLTQRQSNGKFTRDEADELLSRLEDADDGREEAGGPADAPADAPVEAQPARSPARHVARRSTPARASRTARAAEGADEVAGAFPDELLADELRRRGWTCTPPT